MLSPKHYQQVTGIWSANGRSGGQELILPEILSCLLGHNIQSIWLPFYCSGTLASKCFVNGIEVITDPDRDTWNRVPCDEPFEAVYFGTPTLVNGNLLFPDSVLGPEPAGGWTPAIESAMVQHICSNLPDTCRLVLSGLGSGDISYGRREHDLRVLVNKGFGIPHLICMKRFDEFNDYLFEVVKEV